MRLFLYGPPASGKTTLGRRLAAALKVEFFDLDDLIVRNAGKPIRDIFTDEGEPVFRTLESRMLNGFCEKSGSADFVMALGGGTLLREENRRLCERVGEVVCLDAPSTEELERRIAADGAKRPLGNRSAERADHYATFERRIAASFDLGNSLVVVGENFALQLVAGHRLSADANVARIFRDRLGEPMAIVPSGEQHKTPATVMALWQAFARAGLGRRDVVTAVGGGVAGDLTGFAAATWMRGIDWINVPTTLLSMVDASTGGKTGCDLPDGKNLAGAFHSPRLVLVDTAFLRTLPPCELASGKAEMIKHAVIGGLDADFCQMPTAAEVARNLKVKVDIVREDPFETKGRRILLNCGHTVAHAVETLTDYRVSHGEAVAIGCVEEAKLAVRLGLAESAWPGTLAEKFAAAGLPSALPDGLDFARLAPVMRGDKKRDGDSVAFALPCGWGDVRAVKVELKNDQD